MGLYDVLTFMSSFGFWIGMMFASFHVWGIILLFSDILYMLVRYASPGGPMCHLDLCCGECYVACLQFECVLCVCLFVWFMFDCVGELFVECVCYLCGGGELMFSLWKSWCCFWVVLVFCWLVRVLSSKEYVCCVCDPSVCLGVPSICHIWVFVWEMWFQSLTLRSMDHLRFVL